MTHKRFDACISISVSIKRQMGPDATMYACVQGDWKRARKLLLNWHRQHQDYLAKTAKAQGAVTAPATAFRGPGPHCFQCVANACRAAGETDAAETLEYHYT